MQTMKALKENGVKIAIVSNKLDSAVKELNERFFAEYTTSAIGEMEGVARKPAPDMLFQTMKAIGVDTCVYVGDSEVDVITAKAAGVPCLSVLWGFRDREEIEAMGGQHFCTHTSQLVEKLEEIINGQ